jgi:hypothetical protein
MIEALDKGVEKRRLILRIGMAIRASFKQNVVVYFAPPTCSGEGSPAFRRLAGAADFTRLVIG